MRTKEEVDAVPAAKLLQLIEELQLLVKYVERDSWVDEWWVRKVEQALESIGVSPKKTRK